MDTKFQTSFIPKKPIAPVFARRGDSVSVFLVISVVVFVLSLGAALGVFAYKKILIARIAEMDETLVRAKNAFEPDFVLKLSRFDKRVSASRELLSSHGALSPLFTLLENDALATVRFDSFSFTATAGEGGALAMTGRAKNFSSIALQSDVFGEERFIKNPVFSDLNPDQSGNIAFRFSATVDKPLLSFKNALPPSPKATAGRGAASAVTPRASPEKNEAVVSPPSAAPALAEEGSFENP